MDQLRIGSFIAACRRQKGLTQAALAERLGITDRAVSKWETGKCLPDASIMLELCGLLQINVNELLTGERIAMDSYKEMAERNLMELTRMEERNNRLLLTLECVIGYLSTVSFLIILFTACYVQMATALRIILIVAAVSIFLIGCFFALKLEREAGYYECPACRHRYVPTMKAVVLAPHILRSRRMRCPSCGKVGYHKKVLVRHAEKE